MEKVLLGEILLEDRKKSTFIPIHPHETFKRFLIQEVLDEQIVLIGQTILNEVLNEKSTDY